MHRWADVTKQNDSGGCWVTMDGMVFDLEAWLPEHPGGSTIIPQQALNKDCTVFFELYHASRESFTYLREFYIGNCGPTSARGAARGRARLRRLHGAAPRVLGAVPVQPGHDDGAQVVLRVECGG